MAKKKIRRSYEQHRRKLFFFWTVALFFLCLLTVLSIVVIASNYNARHANRALDAEVDFSKISFEGLRLGDEASAELRQNQIIDANYQYSQNNISVGVDGDYFINRLAFFATEQSDGENVSIDDVIIEYRGYPLKTVNDFVTYFGFTTPKNFGIYKYLTYADDKYAVDVTLRDGKIFNIELYAK